MKKLWMVFIVLWAHGAWAEMVRLQGITTQRKGKVFVSELRFDKAPQGEEYSVDFINETIQVNIPGAALAGQKKFKKIKDEHVKSLYSYQIDEDILRHRIILRTGFSASKLENNVRINTTGSKLIVTVDTTGDTTGDTVPTSPIKNVLKSLPEKRIKGQISETEPKTEKLIVNPGSSDDDVVALSKAVAKTIEQEAGNKLSKKIVANQNADLEKSESEIPVLTSVNKKNDSTSGMMWRFVVSVFVIAAIGIGSYLYLKRFKHKGLLQNKHTSIRVLTQHYIGPKRSLAIVRVAGESILVGITEQNINHIKTLSLLDEDVPELTSDRFESQLDQKISADTTNIASSSPDEPADEFSIKGIKDLVSDRLKDMREI